MSGTDSTTLIDPTARVIDNLHSSCRAHAKLKMGKFGDIFIIIVIIKLTTEWSQALTLTQHASFTLVPNNLVEERFEQPSPKFFAHN